MNTRIIGLFVIIMLSFSCSKPIDGGDPDPNYIRVNKTAIELGASVGKVDSISIESDIEWKITTSPAANWVTVDVTEGSGNRKVYLVTSIENVTAGTKTVDLTISPKSATGVQSKVVRVTQRVFNIAIDAQSSFGGTQEEEITDMIALPGNGGLVAVGASFSNDGHVGSNNGSRDAWIIKTDLNGNKIWSKNYGGTLLDDFKSVTVADDGNLLVAGNTHSRDGDIPPDSANGNKDFWVLKVNSNNGAIIWQRNLGGDAEDEAYDFIQLPGGNILIVGYTKSTISGDISRPVDAFGNAWVICLTATGNTVWERSYGGSALDKALDVASAEGDNVMMACYTSSKLTGDVEGGYGSTLSGDIWMVKLNSGNGEIAWQKVIGNSESDNIQKRSLINCPDNGYMIASTVIGPADHDQAGSARSWGTGGGDICIYKLSAAGNVTWVKRFGGSDYDGNWGISGTPDGGAIVSNYTVSNDGDISGYRDRGDAWILKINPAGEKIWQKILGGTNTDKGVTAVYAASGTLFLGMYSVSNDGDVVGNHAEGSGDFWIVKIKGD